jgi:hypothetical protein
VRTSKPFSPDSRAARSACAAALVSIFAMNGEFNSHLGAQNIDDSSNVRLSIAPGTGAYLFSWQGAASRTYFILHNPNLLVPWQFLPIIEQGNDEPLSYGFTIDAATDRFFIRLRHTDAATGGDPYAADFDADGIPNGWEVEHGLNPFDSADAATVVSGLTNLELYQQSLGAGADPTQINTVGMIVYTPRL